MDDFEVNLVILIWGYFDNIKFKGILVIVKFEGKYVICEISR